MTLQSPQVLIQVLANDRFVVATAGQEILEWEGRYRERLWSVRNCGRA